MVFLGPFCKNSSQLTKGAQPSIEVCEFQKSQSYRSPNYNVSVTPLTSASNDKECSFINGSIQISYLHAWPTAVSFANFMLPMSVVYILYNV